MHTEEDFGIGEVMAEVLGHRLGLVPHNQYYVFLLETRSIGKNESDGSYTVNS
jgi:hypothetical protein